MDKVFLGIHRFVAGGFFGPPRWHVQKAPAAAVNSMLEINDAKAFRHWLKDHRTGSVPEQNTGGAVLHVDDGAQHPADAPLNSAGSVRAAPPSRA